MSQFSYHISHEQFDPKTLLELAIKAEEHGFDRLFSSDHFHPWDKVQGQSGLAFAWLGAALQATSLPATVICAPGQRYHPAIVAQAIATLGVMFPNRINVALGSGEAINERITGEPWPTKSDRNKRLKECADVIRALFNGEEVSTEGLIKVEKAILYTRPQKPIPLYGAAITEKTAAWMGTWADGLLTLLQKKAEDTKKTIEAFQQNGGNNKRCILKVQLSYYKNQEMALEEGYQQWRYNIFEPEVLENIWPPAALHDLGQKVSPAEVREKVRISTHLEEHIEWLREDVRLGFDEIILHNVNKHQQPFIEDFGQKVLPVLRKM